MAPASPASSSNIPAQPGVAAPFPRPGLPAAGEAAGTGDPAAGTTKLGGKRQLPPLLVPPTPLKDTTCSRSPRSASASCSAAMPKSAVFELSMSGLPSPLCSAQELGGCDTLASMHSCCLDALPSQNLPMPLVRHGTEPFSSVASTPESAARAGLSPSHPHVPFVRKATSTGQLCMLPAAAGAAAPMPSRMAVTTCLPKVSPAACVGGTEVEQQQQGCGMRADSSKPPKMQAGSGLASPAVGFSRAKSLSQLVASANEGYGLRV